MNDNLDAALRKFKYRLKAVIPPNLNVARELAQLLEVSKEGAYRRLRGASPFTLQELLLITSTYGVSLDYLDTKHNLTPFAHLAQLGQMENFQAYLQVLDEQLELAGQDSNTSVYNLCEDLPFFRQLGYNHLNQFKIYYWLNFSACCAKQKGQFEATDLNSDLAYQFTNLHHKYLHCNTTEIWTGLTQSKTLNQLEYLHKQKHFRSDEECYYVYRDLVHLQADLKRDSSACVKFSNDGEIGGAYHLYKSELYLENGGIYLTGSKPQFLAIGMNGSGSVQTSDPMVLEEYHSRLANVVSNSLLLSGHSSYFRKDFIQENLNQIYYSAKRVLPPPFMKRLQSEMKLLEKN